MDTFKDMSRARRRHHKARRKAEIRRRLRRNSFDVPDPFNLHGFWTDRFGRRRASATWEDIFEFREMVASYRVASPTDCSCSGCGNPRKWFRAATLQECRFHDLACAQYEDAGLRVPRLRFRREW